MPFWAKFAVGRRLALRLLQSDPGLSHSLMPDPHRSLLASYQEDTHAELYHFTPTV